MNNRCPLCKSEQYKEESRYGVIGNPKYACKMLQCCSCNHHFSSVSKNINEKKLYSEEQYIVLDTRKTLLNKIISIDDKLIIQQIAKFKIVGNNLLDFGCGKGQFLKQASEYGWNVKGIETAKERADFGKKAYKLEISSEEYQFGVVTGARFDVIAMFHVLEHLSDPKKLLSELVKDNLAENGFLVLEVPLLTSFQSKISGKRWIHLDTPRHISHFTKDSLEKFLDQINFKPVKYQYFSLHVGLLGMVQSIMSFFGYRKMLIYELKFRRTKKLLIQIVLALIIALPLELLAICLKKGGVIRVYCKRMNQI